jgi:mono/diheme cytochrome c family protein
MKTLCQSILGLCYLIHGINGAEPFDYHSIRGKQAVATETSGKQEGEALPLKGKSRVQGMKNFGPQWSGDAHLLWNGVEGEVMETSFTISKPGRHRFTAVLTLAPDYGIFTVRLNGKVIREGVDLYARGVELAAPLHLGDFDFKAGPQQLSFTLTGGNPQARKFRGSGYLMGIDYLIVENREAKEEAPKEDQPEVAVKAATLKEVQPLLAKYCYECHGAGKKVKGKVNLKELATRSDFLKHFKVAGLGAEAVGFGEMPPEDEKQPSSEERKKIVSFLYGVVDEYARDNTTLEPVVMRRLNRYEYNNAVRDLLQLRGDIYALPEKVVRGSNYFNPASGVLPNKVRVSNRTLGKNQVERQILKDVDPFAIDLQAEHGFNNQGEQLSTSTILLESLLKLGRAIVNSPQFDGYTGLRNSFFKEDDKPIKEKLQPFLERAFRGPVSEVTLDRYAAYHKTERERTKSYTQAMKNVVAAVLASPKFLYLSENKQDAGERTAVNDYELAQRLALFIWSSIPDEELLNAAKRGELRDAKALERQVRRMLLDRRSRALSENFARQWLRLDQLVTAVPDFDRFEVYYSRRGCEQWKFGLQTMIEPLLLFESIQVEDRSIMLLIDSNYAYRSNELQAWYVNPQKPFGNKQNRDRFNTNAQDFSRRALNTRKEGGVITTAAILTMTSTPLRTSPIKRGSWVATVIFNDPPPPPPDVVPEIEEDDAAIAASGLTIRQRLKEHASKQSCASCHAKIDPLGFVLESYDPVGRWRDKYVGDLPIDSKVKLFGEVEVDDVVGFKDAILERPEEFMRGFSEHLLSYALGRELKVTDKPAIDRITRKVMEDHGRFSSVVVEIAKSLPFRNKTNQKERK